MKTFLTLAFVFLLAGMTQAAKWEWVDNSSTETGFALETLQGGVWVEVATVGANVTTFQDALSEVVGRVRAFIQLADGTRIYSTYSNTAALLNAPVNVTVK